ncbi:hypothetical protein [Tsukamurella tyrosinosolvens]|uniref:hypothetical protein n=1 Tax=Tsukamurella tyrosinosolvens TaxID=57704 RepID=UPI0007B23381|nr:hypothetical protein [Tsukamurella tyrosinosolvens]KZL96959.1 hypothetical protein AXX05_15880 [Tsukamurella tyrosinosolvens]
MTALFDVPEAPHTDAPRWNEAKMLGLLREKYTRIRVGTNADRYVRAAHVRYPDRYGLAQHIADYIVLDTYASNELIGFEVKVSRSDWLAELRDPRKADVWRKHCYRWYLVVPDAGIVRDDLPAGWGLIAHGSGGLRVTRRAPALSTPEPMPLNVLCQLGRAIAQTATREAGWIKQQGDDR